MADYEHVVQTFAPVYDKDSSVLILGTLPSVKSRESCFYYGHPQNRFWKVLAEIFEEPVPQTIDEKKGLLLRNRVAIWDVVESCDIIGSSDSSIKNVTAADVASLLQETGITKVMQTVDWQRSFMTGFSQKKQVLQLCSFHQPVQPMQDFH